MMSELTESIPDLDPAAPAAAREALALVIAWSSSQPDRCGEVALIAPGKAPRTLGRGPGQGANRVQFQQQRPGGGRLTGPLTNKAISRDQLTLQATDRRLHVRRIGRCPLLVDGVSVDEAHVRPGQTLRLRGQLLLLCVRRPWVLPTSRWSSDTAFGFGQLDATGMLGESPAAWALRDQLAFHAGHDGHALIHGPSGSGKELAARALHTLSARARGPWVARNAATIPAGLIDAELFGNLRDYPNPGMVSRVGLVGAADGGTLFLDELGELPADAQAHLLRLLDAGEYQTLGDPSLKRAQIRLVGATNRAPDALKHDLRARLKVDIETPGLDARRADIPLLVTLLLRTARRSNPDLAARFFDAADRPRIEPQLVDAWLRHTYTTHVRELDALLWRSMADSPGHALALTPLVQAHLKLPEAVVDGRDPSTITRAELEAALDSHGGNQSAAWRALGLRSRHQLVRLLRKHELR